ncbi:MAG: peptidylprolyl isomerase [bacterium]
MMGYKKASSIIIVILASVFLLNACRNSKVQKSEKMPEGKVAIATVGPITIYQDELDKAFNFRIQHMGNMKDQMPPNQLQEMKQDILGEIIETELLYQKGEELGILPSDEEVETRIEHIKRQFPTEEQFLAQLKQLNVSQEDFKKEIKRNFVISKVIETHLASNQTSQPQEISEEQLKNYYDAHKEKFQNDPMVRASHILIKVENNADEAAWKQAEEKIKEILTKIKNGEDFAELAQKLSNCPSGARGGDLGFFTKERMVPEFSEAAFSMKKGDISDIVKTKFGYHIITVTDTKPAGDIPFEECKDQIRADLNKTKKVDAIKDYIESLRKNTDIKILVPEFMPVAEHP